MTPPSHTNLSKRLWNLPERGLILVILLLATILTLFGGSVQTPVMETNEQGELQRKFQVNEKGERELVLVEKNKFLRAANLAQLAKDTSFIAIMAVGATMIIVAGGIDLSVGAIYALASVLAALFLRLYGPEGPHALELAGPNGETLSSSPGFAVPLGVLLCLAVGTFCGFLNGSMVVALRVHPFIITLGTMAIFRGIAFVSTNGMSISSFPEALRNVVKWEPGGLSVIPLAVMLAVTLIGGLYLSRMAAGRRIYAIGGNELASRYSGIRVGRVRLSVFVYAGLAAGIAAILNLGYYSAATSGDGQGYELKVIAAAVVGGASLSGGKGSALGAVLGALVIQMIDSGIVLLEIEQNYSQIIIGTVIILAVVLDQLNTWLAKQRQLKQISNPKSQITQSSKP